MKERLWKAISEIDGEIFSLGMKDAEIIRLPESEWIEGGEHGIFATRHKSDAEKVIYSAEHRKVLSIPLNMKVIPIIGEIKDDRGKTVVCERILIEGE